MIWSSVDFKISGFDYWTIFIRRFFVCLLSSYFCSIFPDFDMNADLVGRIWGRGDGCSCWQFLLFFFPFQVEQMVMKLLYWFCISFNSKKFKFSVKIICLKSVLIASLEKNKPKCLYSAYKTSWSDDSQVCACSHFPCVCGNMIWSCPHLWI